MLNSISYILNIVLTLKDNNHNIFISKYPKIILYLYLLTNISYFIVLFMINFNFKPHPLINLNVCHNPLINQTLLFILGSVSFIFHYKQCHCFCQNGVDSCIYWNLADYVCVFIYIFTILICFFKLKILLFIPCLILMILGGTFKDLGYYNLYFLFHGIWHIVSAYIIYLTICN